MTDQMQAIHDDLAYMKALATEGKRTPLLGGSILMAGGVIYGVTSLTCWAIQHRLIALSADWAGWIWIIAFFLFIAALVVLIRRDRGKPGAFATSNQAMKAVGEGTGYAAFALAIGALYLSSKFATWYVWVAFSAAILVLYGVSWMVAATLSDRKWPRWMAYGSYLGATVLLLSIGSGYEFLIYGVALLLLAALPGWLLIRGEPSEIV